jgi:hypothetical protein
MNRKVALSIGAVSLFVAAALMFFAPRHCCGADDASQQEFEELLGRATRGNIEAIETMHENYAQSGRTEQARYWALIGAIEGSVKLTETYENLRKSTPNLNTSGEDAIIRKNPSKIGAQRISQTFNISETQPE